MSDDLESGSTPAPTPAPQPAKPAVSASNWEREVLEKLVFATLREQKAARRWGIFFKSLTLLVIVFGLSAYFDYSWTGSDGEALGRHTALIEVEGSIESEGSGSAAVVIPALNKAFSDSGSVAVVLHINSPGGSPVQAGMIVDEMIRLRK
ncbi:MAG TPA: S49 family peptidase, partial [Duganella sp.]|nr:S49 family peptidase [Duganella sp.]